MKQKRCMLALISLVLFVEHSLEYDEYHRSPRNLLRHSAPRKKQEWTSKFWMNEAQAAIKARSRHVQGKGSARNVVMFLGDGMSVPTITAARILMGQRKNQTGEESQLSFEKFPTIGLSKTYCVDAQIPDSACTATAYLCGAKANLGTIGVLGSVPRFDCAASLNPANQVDSITTWALEDGRDVGIVTTARVTHASPAGAYAHTANRDWENDAEVLADNQDPTRCRDIAYQLVNSYPGNQFKVILGGGRQELLPKNVTDEEGTPGMRADGRNLIEQWQKDKIARNVSYQYVWNRNQLLAARKNPPEYLLGLFEGSHLQYHLVANPATEPTLAELTEVAIRLLSRNKKGFFLFVEGGRIDQAHHENKVQLALDETVELDAAVQCAVDILPKDDSLIVVTSDHSHVMAFNGYTHRGGDILGRSDDLDEDGVPYQTLSYTNGPGHRREVNNRRVDVTQEEDYRNEKLLYNIITTVERQNYPSDMKWRSHADVPLQYDTHGGDDVAIFARGPQAGIFAGVYEQSQLPYLMGYAACMGPGAHACDRYTGK